MTTKRIPTADEVLAQQARDHAPRPVKAKAAPPKQIQREASTTSDGSALVPQTKANLPSVDVRDSVTTYLNDVAPSMIVGRMIKFSKEAKFIFADTEEEVDADTDFIALCDQVLVGWIRFHEDAPPDRVMGLLYEGFRMPPREELDDQDESQWPIGLSGAPTDPWQHQICLILQKADTKEMSTFVTTSRTGRSAVGNLLRHYDRMRKSHPGELPVVRLGVGGFQHRDPRVGWVKTPVLIVVGRTPADSAAIPDTSLKAQLDDEIPDFDTPVNEKRKNT
jgi:hypothetical protein